MNTSISNAPARKSKQPMTAGNPEQTAKSSFSVTRAAWSFGINVFAGLVVAAILLFADTTTRVLLAIAVVSVLSLVLSTGFLVYRLRMASKAVDELNGALVRCRSNYEENMASIGIQGVDQLDASEWSPTAIMERAHHEVRFVGVFGRKWVSETTLVERFREMLARIQLSGGRVQFLLLDPAGAASRNIARFRRQADDVYAKIPSIRTYSDLADEFDCFECRLYDHLPIFRLAFVDGRCAVSRYKVHGPEAAGWKAPHAVFVPDSPTGRWTLYQPFSLLFDTLWSEFGRAPEPRPLRIADGAVPGVDPVVDGDKAMEEKKA